MSGSGKRGDAKKTLVIHMYGNDYFGKDQRGAGTRLKKKTPTLSLATLVAQLARRVREGTARDEKGTFHVEAEDYKIVGNDAFGIALHIKARRASAGAVQAVERAGGSISTLSEKESS